MRRRIWKAAVVTVAVVTIAGCSSDAEEGSPDNPVSLPPAESSDTNPDACPFTGGTEPTSGGDAGGTTTVSDVRSSKDGCIDTIQFNFGSSTAKWAVAYSAGAVSDASGAPIDLPSGTNLVVTFEDTTYAPAGSSTAAVTIPPNSLDYVRQITVVPDADGSLQFVLSLDQQLDYLTSSSQTPAYVTLGVG